MTVATGTSGPPHLDSYLGIFDAWRALGGPEAWREALDLSIDACRFHRAEQWRGTTHDLGPAAVSTLAIGLYLSSIELGISAREVPVDGMRALLFWRSPELAERTERYWAETGRADREPFDAARIWHFAPQEFLLDLWRTRIEAAGHQFNDRQDPVAVCWNAATVDLTPDYGAFTAAGQWELDHDPDVMIGAALAQVFDEVAPPMPNLDFLLDIEQEQSASGRPPLIDPHKLYREKSDFRDGMWPGGTIWR